MAPEFIIDMKYKGGNKMNYETNNNKVYLSGAIASEPVFSHEVYGEGFYDLKLAVNRLSEQKDVLPVTISERLINYHNLTVGSEITLIGQFRSYNKIIDGRSKLMLTVFVRELVPYDEGKNPNIIELKGYICKPPVYRTTPFNREICDILLAINRSYNKSDYLPTIAWGRNARYVKNLQVGEHVSVTGRIQSREYQKKTDDQNETRVAYEISVSKIAVCGAGETPIMEEEEGERVHS